MNKSHVLIAGSVALLCSLYAALPNASPAAMPTASAPAAPAADQEQFMRRKLAMVQNIVEGISTEDFALVDAGGRELLKIAESASWNAGKDPYYRHYSANFEHATRGLVEAARAQSVEKATFAFTHVMFSCTTCHQHVRNAVRLAR